MLLTSASRGTPPKPGQAKNSRIPGCFKPSLTGFQNWGLPAAPGRNINYSAWGVFSKVLTNKFPQENDSNV